ncbi:MAG: polysaccharide biosynthesis protein [Clostridia bacterium]|nr:polysaccharide biosynthesis protein [Clostridia bacterium]
MAVTGVYKPLWRYATIRDLLGCFFGTAIGASFSYVVMILLTYFGVFGKRFSLLYTVLNFTFSLILILTVRIAYKMLRDYTQQLEEKAASDNKTRTLIIGAGATCSMVLTEIKMGNSNYFPVGAVDDDPTKIGRKIKNLPIYGPVSRVPEICKELNIDTILVAVPSCTEEERRIIIEYCSQTDCRIHVLPFLHDLIAGSNLLTQAKPIQLEELLGRAPISFDSKDIAALIKGKVCMVTGGGGSIGSELCRQIASYAPKKLVVVDIYENNAYDIQQELVAQYGEQLSFDVHIASVRDYTKMMTLFERYRPELVFHAAAHKHVPLMETAPEEAVKNSVIGTFNVATLAEYYKAEKFVLISTDKAVNPTNVMGATKRICEMIVQSMAQHGSETDFVAVRFGNVLGSNGSVIPLFRRQIEAGGPVTVTHPDIIRYFMTIPEAVSLVLQAGAMAQGGEIFVLDMGKPVKITTLAENLIRLYGYRPGVDIRIEFTGLRPGEKLFEELLMNEEGLKPTYNEKIFIGSQIHVDSQSFARELADLKAYALHNQSDKVVDMIAQIVPTFHHALNR